MSRPRVGDRAARPGRPQVWRMPLGRPRHLGQWVLSLPPALELEREPREPQTSCTLSERGEQVPQRNVAVVKVRRRGQVLDRRLDVPLLLLDPREVLGGPGWWGWGRTGWWHARCMLVWVCGASVCVCSAAAKKDAKRMDKDQLQAKAPESPTKVRVSVRRGSRTRMYACTDLRRDFMRVNLRQR